MIWIIVIVAVVVVAFVALRVVQSADDKKFEAEKFVPQRKWGWEKRLSDAEEASLMAGLAAYDQSGKSVYVSHLDGLLSHDEPRMKVSLWLLADRWKALGPGVAADPLAAVKGLMDGFAAREEPGVLHFRDPWFPEDGVDGWNNDQLTEEARKVLDGGSAAGLPGLSGWFSDENYGEVRLGVLVGPFPEIDALRAAGKFEDVQVAETFYKNNLVVDLARAIDRYRALRAERAELAPPAALKIALVEIVHGQIPGATWSRVPPRPEEEAVVRASVEGEGRPAQG